MLSNVKSEHKLTPEQKLIEALKLYYLAWELKRAFFIEFKSDIKKVDIDKMITESFLNARY